VWLATTRIVHHSTASRLRRLRIWIHPTATHASTQTARISIPKVRRVTCGTSPNDATPSTTKRPIRVSAARPGREGSCRIFARLMDTATKRSPVSAADAPTCATKKFSQPATASSIVKSYRRWPPPPARDPARLVRREERKDARDVLRPAMRSSAVCARMACRTASGNASTCAFAITPGATAFTGDSVPRRDTGRHVDSSGVARLRGRQDRACPKSSSQVRAGSLARSIRSQARGVGSWSSAGGPVLP